MSLFHPLNTLVVPPIHENVKRINLILIYDVILAIVIFMLFVKHERF